MPVMVSLRLWYNYTPQRGQDLGQPEGSGETGRVLESAKQGMALRYKYCRHPIVRRSLQRHGLNPGAQIVVSRRAYAGRESHTCQGATNHTICLTAAGSFSDTR